MILTKNHIGGLIFLCLSIVYGYYAGQIQMIPGDEFEPFNAQTIPSALAVLGVIFSLALLVTSRFDPADRVQLSGYDFLLVAKLLVLIVLFSLALKWIGFFVSTTLFLIGGYWLLGERRIKMLILASLPFALGIWLILAKMLDIYLAPGTLFTSLLGG